MIDVLPGGHPDAGNAKAGHHELPASGLNLLNHPIGSGQHTNDQGMST